MSTGASSYPKKRSRNSSDGFLVELLAGVATWYPSIQACADFTTYSLATIKREANAESKWPHPDFAYIYTDRFQARFPGAVAGQSAEEYYLEPSESLELAVQVHNEVKAERLARKQGHGTSAPRMNHTEISSQGRQSTKRLKKQISTRRDLSQVTPDGQRPRRASHTNNLNDLPPASTSASSSNNSATTIKIESSEEEDASGKDEDETEESVSRPNGGFKQHLVSLELENSQPPSRKTVPVTPVAQSAVNVNRTSSGKTAIQVGGRPRLTPEITPIPLPERYLAILRPLGYRTLGDLRVAGVQSEYNELEALAKHLDDHAEESTSRPASGLNLVEKFATRRKLAALSSSP